MRSTITEKDASTSLVTTILFGQIEKIAYFYQKIKGKVNENLNDSNMSGDSGTPVSLYVDFLR